MIKQKKWYALYVRPKWEKKVADLLEKKNITHYCPVRKVQKQWADRKKTILEPLFTSYVFVQISQFEYVPTMETDGVIKFVQHQGKAAVIRDEEINIIRTFLSEYDNVIVEKDVIRNHDKIRVLNGPLEWMEGEVLEVKNKTVKVLLPSLGYNLVAEVEKQNIEKLHVH